MGWPRPSTRPAGRSIGVLGGVAALAGLLAGACSSDSTQVADKVREAAAQELQVAEADLATTCPEGATAEEGATFDCQVVLQDQPIAVHVAFTSDERFTVDLDGRVFQRRAIEDQVRQQLESEQLLGTALAELRCGDHDLLVLQQAATITCRGRDSAGNEGGAEVALDESGNAVVRKITR
jgi:hypothetical protein